MKTILPDPLPSISPAELEKRLDALHEAEHDARMAAAEALLRGLPGEAARSELQRLRVEIDVTHGALRLLAAMQPRHR